MGKAQGELRGQLTRTNEPEAQYLGGEGGGGAEVAARTAAAKAYRDRMASHHLQEVWRSLGRGRPALLVGYRRTHGGAPLASYALGASLRRQRRAALGY